MTNRIYYHVYLDDLFSWATIFVDQMTMMEKEDLLKNVDKIKITAITINDIRADRLKRLCQTFPVNIELTFIENKYNNDFEMLSDWEHLQKDVVKPLNETLTISKLYNDCLNEDLNVLYLHAKSVTALSNTLIKYGIASKFKNRHLWRQFMNWGVIGNWKTCVDSLNSHDTAGIDYRNNPPHYKGNFWWTKSSHVRTLQHPENDHWWNELKQNSQDPWIRNVSNRFRSEFWVCSRPNTKSFNIKENDNYYVDNDI